MFRFSYFFPTQSCDHSLNSWDRDSSGSDREALGWTPPSARPPRCDCQRRPRIAHVFSTLSSDTMWLVWRSCHTMSTVGYGSLYTTSDYCTFVMLFQSFCNIALVAIIMSSFFINFSQPK